MPVVVIATGGQQNAEKCKIPWLLEDIWLYKNGDAELQLECIIESGTEIREILILLPYYVDTVDNLGHLYKDPSFQDGYPKCWPDLYSQFEIESNKHVIVKFNNFEAKVGEIQTKLRYRTSNFSEINVKFDPPVSNEQRIFRLGLLCRGIILRKKKIIPSFEKQLIIYSYGMGPFAGSQLDSLLVERKMPRDSWLQVEKEIIYIKLWDKELVITSYSIPTSRSYPFGECEFMPRYCPPLERMAERLKKNVMQLKKQESYCVVWELQNILPSAGQLIIFKYFPSEIQKWLSENWLTLLAFFLAFLSILITLLK